LESRAAAAERVDRWFAENTFHSKEFANIAELVRLKKQQGLTISLELPHVAGLLVDSVTDGVPLVLSKPNSEWGNRVAELATMVVDASIAKARMPKRGFFGRPR